MNLTRPLILASNSPRRHQILQMAGLNFEVRTLPVEETYPSETQVEDVARVLAQKKATAFAGLIDQEIVIGADTVVVLEEQLLGKPADLDEAREMLSLLSGKSHQVITGICLFSSDILDTFDDSTQVRFRELTASEIDYYVEKYQPLDKAGAYGIQEWIGMVGIEEIKGSFFNVVGLPVQKLYQKLSDHSLILGM